ncbi:MAG: hypothetical protein K5907_01190 [Treponema sp.]|nr:hypothetical protein [Treponema sp.]
MVMDFESWTDYDNWLVQNYENFSIYKVEEASGKIHIEYCNKADFPSIRDKDYKKPERRV